MKKIFTLFAAGFSMAMTANAQLPNPGLETWRNYTIANVAMEAPNGWFGSDSILSSFAALAGGAQKQVFKSTDTHGGSFAACLVSKYYGGFANIVAPGALTNANVSVDIVNRDFLANGGTPVTQRVSSVSAWLKYIPKGTDTATFGVDMVIAGIGANGTDSIVGSGIAYLTGTGPYQQVTVPVTYINSSVMPSHIQVAFMSGSFTTGVDSSVLVVDDVSMMLSSGISQQLMNAEVVRVFPNPATGTLYINTKEKAALQFEALAANGQVIASKSFTGETSLPLGDIPAGMYYFRVLNANKEMVQTGKFLVK